MRNVGLVVFAVMTFASSAAAQSTVGGAVIVSRLPRETYVPGTFTPPPNGLTHGVTLFGAAALAPRIGLQGELSIPGELVTLRQFLRPGATFEDRTEHRDTILSGLLRLQAASWCEVLVGGGVTFERTKVTQTARDDLTGGIFATTESSSASRATLTAGVDLPIRLSQHFSVLPTGRLHVISRDTDVPKLDTRTLSPPSKYTFRFGIGARIEF